MNSYRTLTYKELNLLEEDFTDFLYLEGYSQFDWKVLSEQHSEFALDMLNKYSDMTFEKVMKSIRHIEIYYEGRLKTIYCHSNYFDIIAIDLNIIQQQLFQHNNFTLNKNILSKDKKQKVLFKKLKYSIKREKEIFDLIERGFQTTGGENYFFLKALKKTFDN